MLWVPNSSSLDPQKLKMDLLTQAAVRKIAIANPQHAPYGRAAMAALEYFGLNEKFEHKLVLGENISQAAQFVQSGNAQAGLIAAFPGLLFGDEEQRNLLGSFRLMPTRVASGGGDTSKHKQAAKAFLDYVTRSEGKVILERFGFRTPVSP